MFYNFLKEPNRATFLVKNIVSGNTVLKYKGMYTGYNYGVTDDDSKPHKCISIFPEARLQFQTMYLILFPW